MLPRPFKITKVGPVSLFVEDVDRAENFYTERLGFVRSEEAVYRGARCVFLRCGAEHHSVGLFPKELRRTLGLSEHTTCMSFGVEVGSYAQLREAVAFLKAHGVTFVDSIPPELYPGIDYSAFALDPGRPLHPALLLHGADRLGRPGAPGVGAASRQWPMAGGTGIALRHLCRPGVPRPIGLKTPVCFR